MNHLAISDSLGILKKVASSQCYVNSRFRMEHLPGLETRAAPRCSSGPGAALPEPLPPRCAVVWLRSAAGRLACTVHILPLRRCRRCRLAQLWDFIGQPWRKMNATSSLSFWCCSDTRGRGEMFPQELAQKIKGYQEQISSLNSKCKMLTMKAKHATMLLTVTEVDGLAEGTEDLDGELLPATSAHPSVVMVSKGQGLRCWAPARALRTVPWPVALVAYFSDQSCRLGLTNSLLNSLTTFGPRPTFDTVNSDSWNETTCWRLLNYLTCQRSAPHLFVI